MSTIDISKLNIQERLEVMEAIWNSLVTRDSEMESPDWHKETLTIRKNRIRKQQAEFITLHELKTKYSK
jgi:hypothetical protein